MTGLQLLLLVGVVWVVGVLVWVVWVEWQDHRWLRHTDQALTIVRHPSGQTPVEDRWGGDIPVEDREEFR